MTPPPQTVTEDPQGERLLDAGEVAERLGLPESWVLDRARKGKIPKVPLGHYVRFRPSSIDRWIAEQETDV